MKSALYAIIILTLGSAQYGQASAAAASACAKPTSVALAAASSSAPAGAAGAQANAPRHNKSKGFLGFGLSNPFKSGSQKLIDELNGLKDGEIFASESPCADTALIASGIDDAVNKKSEKERDEAVETLIPKLKKHKANVDPASRKTIRTFAQAKIATQLREAEAAYQKEMAAALALMNAKVANITAAYAKKAGTIKKWAALKSATHEFEGCDSDEENQTEVLSADQLAQSITAGMRAAFPTTVVSQTAQAVRPAVSKKRKRSSTDAAAAASAQPEIASAPTVAVPASSQPQYESLSAEQLAQQRPPAFVPGYVPSAPPAEPAAAALAINNEQIS